MLPTRMALRSKQHTFCKTARKHYYLRIRTFFKRSMYDPLLTTISTDLAPVLFLIILHAVLPLSAHIGLSHCTTIAHDESHIFPSSVESSTAHAGGTTLDTKLGANVISSMPLNSSPLVSLPLACSKQTGPLTYRSYRSLFNLPLPSFQPLKLALSSHCCPFVQSRSSHFDCTSELPTTVRHCQVQLHSHNDYFDTLLKLSLYCPRCLAASFLFQTPHRPTERFQSGGVLYSFSWHPPAASLPLPDAYMSTSFPASRRKLPSLAPCLHSI